MKDEILLEMMASTMQEMYDEGYGAEFRPAMQNVLVAFNNRGLTPLALDGGNSAASEQLSTPEVLSTLQGESTPAHRK